MVIYWHPTAVIHWCSSNGGELPDHIVPAQKSCRAWASPRADIAAQARARHRAVPGTGTMASGPGRVSAVFSRAVLVSAHRARPIWKTIRDTWASVLVCCFYRDRLVCLEIHFPWTNKRAAPHASCSHANVFQLGTDRRRVQVLGRTQRWRSSELTETRHGDTSVGAHHTCMHPQPYHRTMISYVHCQYGNPGIRKYFRFWYDNILFVFNKYYVIID